jgi:aspartate/methionine/tyrosine aminotransferase
VTHSFAAGKTADLRTGTPYARLVVHQTLFSTAVGEHFDVSPADVLPTAGSTGAIEACRNHIFRLSRRAGPTVLTVCPGYWRARESFEGFGFNVVGVSTEGHGFSVPETLLAEEARGSEADLVYLSLPNNPTGAVFDPEPIVTAVSDSTAIVLDMTLPGRELDTRALTRRLYRKFRDNRRLFLIGSTSKSHGTAESRIGWLICANSNEAAALKKENRNVVACAAIEQAVARLGNPPVVFQAIEASFALLKEGEIHGRYRLIRPEKRVQTAYVLIRLLVSPDHLRCVLDRWKISVMWGSEFGLTERYVRLETSEPESIRLFLDAINSLPGDERDQ